MAITILKRQQTKSLIMVPYKCWLMYRNIMHKIAMKLHLFMTQKIKTSTISFVCLKIKGFHVSIYLNNCTCIIFANVTRVKHVLSSHPRDAQKGCSTEVNIGTKLKFGNILFGCLRQVLLFPQLKIMIIYTQYMVNFNPVNVTIWPSKYKRKRISCLW